MNEPFAKVLATEKIEQQSMVRQAHHDRAAGLSLLTIALLLCCSAALFLLSTERAFAQEDMIRFVEKKRLELNEMEESLKKEEERLKAIRKDVDERIDKYSKILSQIEEALKKLQEARNERIEHLVKSYEAMPNEEAAARLSALDEPTAIKILLKMKNKKAGAVMALMEPKKVSSITEGMIRHAKKIPTR